MEQSRQPNVGSDPINPAYYAGTACAEIIEHMPTNVGFAAKYAWRLGEKDTETQEAGKAIWYLEREVVRQSYNNLMPLWFIPYTQDRTRSAVQIGKLDLRRSQIIHECAMWTVHAELKHLERAMILFQFYLGDNNEDHQ